MMSQRQIVNMTLFIISNIVCSIPLTAQGWEWQNPLPTGNSLLCIEFVDSLTGWFGSSAGTILHTTDGGNSWEIQHTGIEDFHSHSIDFINHQEGWATGVDGPSYIIHTTNSGKNWTIQLIDSSWCFGVITFKDQKHGWVDRSFGDIYYTIDGGATWEIGRSGQGYNEDVQSIVFIDTLCGWAEGPGMPLLYSEDGGRSWKADTTGIIGTMVFFSDALHGWITSWDRLLRTVDGGKTWLDDLSNVTGDPHALLTDLFFADTLSGWVTVWEEGTFRTTDGGLTWEQITTETPYMLNGAYFFFTSLSGWIEFARTWDGGKTLIHQKQGFTLNHLSDVDFIDENTGWVVGIGGLIAKTSNGGKTWQLQESGTQSWLTSVFSLNERNVWAVGAAGVVLKTEDGGETWNLQHYQVSASHNAHESITFVDSLNGWIVGGYFDVGGWILHTEDGGATWEEQTPGVIPRLFDVTFVDENTGWAVAGGGSVYDVGAVYHTTDGGETWIPQLENQPHGFQSVCFVNENTGWAGGDDWIVHTEDGGENWVVQSVGEGIFPDDLFFIDENTGWTCGIIGKVFYTLDGGVTWQKQYTGTTQTLQGIYFIDKNTGWIAGWNGSILHTTMGGTTDVEKNFYSEFTAKDFHLYPNYPNPFNSQTIISYELPKKGHARLTVYDILGREVIILVNDVKSSGVHRVTWYGRDKKGGDVPSGIYFYNLQFGDVFQKTGKMVLVR